MLLIVWKSIFLFGVKEYGMSLVPKISKMITAPRNVESNSLRSFDRRGSLACEDLVPSTVAD
jgi:hypothetical protein